MAIVIAVTLYLTFFAFLMLPHLGAPAIFPRMAIGLCVSEFVAAVGWGMTRSTCDLAYTPSTTCPPETDNLFASVAAIQIPILTGALFVVATAYGLFVARRW